MTASFVYLYCRISADQQGRGEGVAAQKNWGLEYAAATWPGTPVKIFSDNDLSAAKDDVQRPEFERMREGIRRGECAHLWSVEQSRLARIESVWFGLVSDLVKAGVTEVHTRRQGIIDVDGVVAGIFAVLGAHEVKQMRKRLLDKKSVLAAEGRPDGQLGFGYRQVIRTPEEEARLREWQELRHQATIRGEDMREWKEANPRPAGGRPVIDEQGRKSAVIIEEEARIVRECAHRLLNGWGLRAIATWLHNQGLRGKNGGRFVATSVSDFLTAPSVAGYRVHRGQIVGKGTWQPILDEATWRSVCAVIGTRKKTRHRSRRAYLLTGYRMFCECGKPMQARPSGDFAYYACETAVTDGCGTATVDAQAIERHVADELFSHLEELGAAGMLPGDGHAERRDEIVTQLEALDARRAELSEMWNARDITTDQFKVMNAGLAEEQRVMEGELATLPLPASQASPEDLRAAWPEMPLEEKRKVIDDWIERITVKATGDKRYRRYWPVSQKDVAERAGVSQAFVSQVIRGKARSSVLEERVRAAIDALGYVPGPSTKKAERPAANTDGISIIWR